MTGTWLLLAATTVVTSALSGALGMAGGVLLLTVLQAALPPGVAMVVHGVAQFTSNGSRFVVQRRHADLRRIGAYAAAAILAAAAAFAWLPRVAPGWMHVALGVVALAAVALRGRALPSFDTRAGAAACGASVTGVQIVAGVAGPLLDAFFLRSSLGRHAVVATKAATQTIAHALKTTFWILSGGAGAISDTPAWAVAAIVVAAVAGTVAGSRVLDRFSDAGFRRATTWIVGILGAGHLVWGARLIAG